MQGGRKTAELVSVQTKLLERRKRFEVGGYRTKLVIWGSENPEEEEGTKKASVSACHGMGERLVRRKGTGFAAIRRIAFGVLSTGVLG